MKQLVNLSAFLLLAGCATHPIANPLAFCGDNASGNWHSIVSKPNEAKRMEALADSSPNFPAGKFDYQIEQWFASDNGKFMLCRHDESWCSGEWWQFHQDNHGLAMTKQNSWICVTKAWPNNSFKPNLLRGGSGRYSLR